MSKIKRKKKVYRKQPTSAVCVIKLHQLFECVWREKEEEKMATTPRRWFYFVQHLHNRKTYVHKYTEKIDIGITSEKENLIDSTLKFSTVTNRKNKLITLFNIL